MTRTAVLLFHVFAWTSMLTGVVYGVMRYWPIPEDSMELVAHPSQPHVQHAHILLSAALTLLLGYVAGCHAVPYALGKGRVRRRSGWTLLATVAPMVLSGFALQTSTSEFARSAWSAAHIATSLVWSAGLVIHLALARRPWNRRTQAD